MTYISRQNSGLARVSLFENQAHKVMVFMFGDDERKVSQAFTQRLPPHNQPIRKATFFIVAHPSFSSFRLVGCTIYHLLRNITSLAYHKRKNAGMSFRSHLFSFLLICFAAIPHATWSSSPQPARRCLSGWKDDTIALFDDFSHSTCELCDPYRHVQRSYFDAETTKNLPHIGIMLPYISSLAEPFFTISAVLLMRGHAVTMFLNKRHTKPPFQDCREFIQDHVPCDAQLAVSNLLRIEYIPMDSYPCFDVPDKSSRIHCAIREAGTFLTERFKSSLQAHPVDVLILDAGLIAGQLAANSLGIPVLALFDPDFYDDLLVRRWINTRVQTWWGLLGQRLAEFWEELEWMSSFANYNRIRRRLGLPKLSTITEIWNSVTLILTNPRETRASGISVVEGPLLTPCIPCTIPSPIEKFPSYNARAILNLKSAGNNPKLTRDLFKAFWMARDSLSQWSLSCKSGRCPENVTDLYDFGVARIGPSHEKFLPHFVAPFGADVSFLAALGFLLASGEKILLIAVDSDTLHQWPWIQVLDPPILDVSRERTVREMTKEILLYIHRNQPVKDRLRTAKGMEPVLISLLQKTTWTFNGTNDIYEDNDSTLFFSWWVGLSFVLAFSWSILELYKEGESWERIGEIIWKQFAWIEVEVYLRTCQAWARCQWNGDGDSKQVVAKSSVSSSSTSHSHRRRRSNKKKQA